MSEPRFTCKECGGTGDGYRPGKRCPWCAGTGLDDDVVDIPAVLVACGIHADLTWKGGPLPVDPADFLRDKV